MQENLAVGLGISLAKEFSVGAHPLGRISVRRLIDERQQIAVKRVIEPAGGRSGTLGVREYVLQVLSLRADLLQLLGQDNATIMKEAEEERAPCNGEYLQRRYLPRKRRICFRQEAMNFIKDVIRRRGLPFDHEQACRQALEK